MKPICNLLAGVLALGMIGSAAAQTVITITGSTAYRGATHNAILSALSGEVYAYTGTSLSGASQAIFSGNLGSTPVIVKTSWSGSITGIVSLRNSATVNTLPNNTTMTAGGNALGDTTGTDPRVPDLSMSDVSQTSTPFTSPSLQERGVGIIPFRFVAGFGAPASLTNITSQMARLLFSNGYLPLAMATGNPTDRTTMVTSTYAASFFPPFDGQAPFMLYALGRNAGSGTRFLTFAETGVGVSSFVNQYQPTVSGTSVTNQQLWPEETINGILYPEGNSGYESGGDLRNVMRLNTIAGIGGVYVSVLGISDANFVITSGNGGAGNGKTLTYNGVEYSDQAIEEGQYTLWSAEQLINRTPLTPGSTLDDFITALVPLIRNADAIYNNLHVSRNNDGATVFPLYP